MLGINEYVKLILRKKKWTKVKFAEELNKVEAKLGDKRTAPQNVWNRLSGEDNLSPKTLAKYEVALGLPFGTLLDLTPNMPISKKAKKELENYIEKARE